MPNGIQFLDVLYMTKNYKMILTPVNGK